LLRKLTRAQLTTPVAGGKEIQNFKTQKEAADWAGQNALIRNSRASPRRWNARLH
jgi:hypothetical protein